MEKFNQFISEFIRTLKEYIVLSNRFIFVSMCVCVCVRVCVCVCVFRVSSTVSRGLSEITWLDNGLKSFIRQQYSYFQKVFSGLFFSTESSSANTEGVGMPATDSAQGTYRGECEFRKQTLVLTLFWWYTLWCLVSLDWFENLFPMKFQNDLLSESRLLLS